MYAYVRREFLVPRDGAAFPGRGPYGKGVACTAGGAPEGGAYGREGSGGESVRRVGRFRGGEGHGSFLENGNA